MEVSYWAGHSFATNTAHCLDSQDLSKKAMWNHWVLDLWGKNLNASFPLPLSSFLVEVRLLALWGPPPSWLCSPAGSQRSVSLQSCHTTRVYIFQNSFWKRLAELMSSKHMQQIRTTISKRQVHTLCSQETPVGRCVPKSACCCALLRLLHLWSCSFMYKIKTIVPLSRDYCEE